MEDHPGIVFRDGPSGRQAALATGPDAWEVVAAMRASGESGAAAVQSAADWSGLSLTQVRAAVRYFNEYPEEIEERIRRNVEEADEAEAAWGYEVNALG